MLSQLTESGSGPRRQAYQFAHGVMPSLTHKKPKELFEGLDARGHKFLVAHWMMAGSGLQGDDRVSPDGLSVQDLEGMIPGRQSFLITFPQPEEPTEAYGALVSWFDGRPDTAAYFALERGTLPGEAFWSRWTATGSRICGNRLPTTDPHELIVVALRDLPEKPPPPVVNQRAKHAKATTPCRGCKTPVVESEAYFSPAGPVCYPCHNRIEERDAEIRAADEGAYGRGHGLSDGSDKMVRILLILAIKIPLIIGFAVCGANY